MYTRPMPIDVISFESLDSTSRFVRRELASDRLAKRPVAVIAGKQTDGIGRLGRPWESPKGGLWLTLYWPDAPTGRGAVLMGLRFAWAVMASIESVVGPLGQRFTLKWPNDIYLDGRKVAGLLTEVIVRHGNRAVLVGIGVNANTSASDYPPEIRPSIQTLREALGRDIDLRALRVAVLDRVEQVLTTPPPGDLVEVVGRRLHGLGQYVEMTMADRVKQRVRVLGLAEDGRLRVDQDGRELSLISTYE